jgi:hypothetical protein
MNGYGASRREATQGSINARFDEWTRAGYEPTDHNAWNMALVLRLAQRLDSVVDRRSNHAG